MSKPRIFIGSTYYDLRYIREDVERFIKEMGYEPIRHETGSIPYSKEIPLEEAAYREITQCDIIVCIIGGRYGTESSTREGSITQNELQEALKKQIQVYVFIEQNVLSEYSTYLLNKENKSTIYRFVDNALVYEFLEKIYALPQNNPITPFSTSADVCDFLKTQWAGLFQRFLQEKQRLSELQILDEMSSVSSTLKELVAYLTKERLNQSDAIKSILLSNHPAFREFAKITGTTYRVFFTTRSELDKWLEARNYLPVTPEALDQGSIAEWFNNKRDKYIKLIHKIFDDGGRLIPITDEEWQEDWLTKGDTQVSSPSEEDIPF
jgi:hypothetical protein